MHATVDRLVGKSNLFEMDLLLGTHVFMCESWFDWLWLWMPRLIRLSPPHVAPAYTDINSEVYPIKQGEEIALMLTK